MMKGGLGNSEQQQGRVKNSGFRVQGSRFKSLGYRLLHDVGPNGQVGICPLLFDNGVQHTNSWT